MLSYIKKIMLLAILPVLISVPLLSREHFSAPLNLVQEDDATILAEASPFYILSNI